MSSHQSNESKLAHKIFPYFLYGTAWKEESTQELTILALKSGFTGIDTANQRKHYFEEAVGLGIQQFLKISGKKRDDLFLQTKFTYAAGQDHRKPYNEHDSYAAQVRQSIESSLQHLQTDYIDSFILHGPLYNQGIDQADLEVWGEMEKLAHQGQVKFLGVSNVTLDQLKELHTKSSIKPYFVQNRCFAVKQWDQKIRQFCKTNGIIYQGFSMLTANQNYLATPVIQSMATKYEKTVPQIIFNFAQNIGILPLTGTTNEQHMHEDLNSNNFQLTSNEIELIESISTLF